MKHPESPLEGLLVIDLSRVLAGPYMTQAMGDMGARVIKIEEPGKGDDTRRYGPPFVEGEASYFLSLNRNKESVTLNLRHPRGREVLWSLLDRADVLVENFRPGTLERLGFSWNELHQRNPRLVLTQITGYGQRGPWSHRPGYDLVAQGEGGVMSLTGDPDGPPTKVGVSQADVVAGMWALNGTLLALYARERTGVGQRVDASLFDGQLSLHTYQASNYFATGKPGGRMGNRHPSISPYETFKASDGWFNLALGNESFWQKFCSVVEIPGLAGDARFSSISDRLQNRDALEAVLAPHFHGRTVAEWLRLLGDAALPCGPILDVGQALESEHARAREMVVTVDHPTIGPWRMVGVPVQLSGTPGAPRSAPPLLGQHTDSVLRGDLGISEAELHSLRAEGVI